MIRFIWRNWWRHKERFILLIAGALIVGSGLSDLVGMAQSNAGTVVDALEKKWSASYDIVVRPPGSRSATEDKHLLESNYLSGLSGGISLDQYHKIQKIEGVEVAAPIAMIGYIFNPISLTKITFEKNGIYRIHNHEAIHTGPKTVVREWNDYYTFGPWWPPKADPKYGVDVTTDRQLELATDAYVLLAGIDPKAEAKLVGLNQAVIKGDESRYFEDFDEPSQNTTSLGTTDIYIPALLNARPAVDKKYTYTIERLDLPFQNANEAAKIMETVKEKGGAKYLDTIKATDRRTYTFTEGDAQRYLIESFTGIDPKTGKKVDPDMDRVRSQFHWISDKPSPLDLRPVSSPYPKQWPYAYETKIFRDPPIFPTDPAETYRPKSAFGKQSSDWPRVVIRPIGIYDPKKLDIAQDPLTELPMETYRPASAKLVLNAEGKPVNPPIEVKPSDDPYDFLTQPPTVLTTIDAAAKILGDKPISAIRIKVAGVHQFNEASQKKLQHIADRITAETGLITDITLGSSPQLVLTHIPSIQGRPSIGWIEQPWVKIGSTFTIFQETKVGFSGVIASVILVAVIYVFSSLLVSMLARRKELAVLLAVGWRPRQLANMIFWEAGLIGAFVAIVAWAILALVLSVHQTETTLFRVLSAGGSGFAIYGLGAVIPAVSAMRIRPLEAIHAGEVSRVSRRFLQTKGLISLAFGHLLGTWRRSLLSLLAIAVSASLLIFFLFVTWRLKGILYTTLLGEYVALEVGPQHYIAMAVAVLIAMLTTAEVMWQNVADRQTEIALFKAVGWPDRGVRLLILLEGGLTGLLAALLGLALAFAMMGFMYRQVPLNQIGFLLPMGSLPILIGIMGAILPAERAVRMMPAQGVRGSYANLKETEKKFRLGLGIAAAGLMAGFLLMMFTTLPTAKPEADRPAHQEKVVPTNGKVTAGNQDAPKKKTKQTDNGSAMPNATKDYKVKLGEPVEFASSTLTVTRLTDDMPPATKAHIDKYEEKLAPDMKYLTVQMFYKNPGPNNTFFEPLYSQLKTDAGTQKPVYYSVVKGDKSWSGGYVPPGKSLEVAVTYRIPKNAKLRSITFNNVFLRELNKKVTVDLEH